MVANHVSTPFFLNESIIDKIIKDSTNNFIKIGKRADEATKLGFLDAVQAVETKANEKKIDLSLDTAMLRKDIMDCKSLGELNKCKSKLIALASKVGI